MTDQTPIVPTKLAYNIDEAAQAMGLSRRTIYNLMERGALPWVVAGGRRLIKTEALQALLD